jgi:hypothetical protein
MFSLSKILGHITVEEAVRIARAECDARGWPWQEPISVHRGLWTIHVRTNTEYRGGNASVIINARTGSIKGSGYMNR